MRNVTDCLLILSTITFQERNHFRSLYMHICIVIYDVCIFVCKFVYRTAMQDFRGKYHLLCSDGLAAWCKVAVLERYESPSGNCFGVIYQHTNRNLSRLQEEFVQTTRGIYPPGKHGLYTSILYSVSKEELITLGCFYVSIIYIMYY